MLTFKKASDLKIWRSSLGDDVESRHWITLFHALSSWFTGKPAVVTSWYRDDNTGHRGGRCVDFRVRHYEDGELAVVMEAAIQAGIPVVMLREGTPHAHLHCGDLATLVSE